MVNVAVEPSRAAVVHGSCEPYGPDAQFTARIAAGACTVTAGCAIVTSQSVPIAFHTSSSWSANAFMTRRTR